MLLGLSSLRISELKPARNVYRSVYSVKGPARITHRLAVITCVALALIPLMQANARLAQTISSVHYLPVAPYEIFSAPLLGVTMQFACNSQPPQVRAMLDDNQTTFTVQIYKVVDFRTP